MQIEDIYKDLPTLETERLRLRKITSNDLEDLFKYGSDPEVTKFVTWETHKTLSDSKAFIDFALHQYEKNQIAPWAIEYKQNGKLIGTVDFVWWKPNHNSAEIGYVLSREYWGKGFMTEAVKRLITFGFENMDLVRIQAKSFKDNIASERVMIKAGMVYEGTHRKEMLVKGEHQDLKTHAILKEDFYENEQLSK
ncbi:GNAT family N-acetyltransferase [Halalkalibacillus sediminis]|uniref:GNAT family N-acetyltransferase n=1 Tax=Halalkalibacillus sediminis TaxID=2018042 RepID=A0A2I0QRA8_9BACI|nr:GNAT family protein [Halalkalibacillus sediminis]PKR76872.1 GNAT family N-acetyltransferase [Halalkalibacillus sediminis]